MGLWHLSLLLVFSFSGNEAAVFTLQNNCKTTVWPGILPGGTPELKNGGFELKSNQKVEINMPKGWSGRLWGRGGCTFDQSGKGNCVTGDCGRDLECSGAGGAPPASLAEFTLDSPLDFYDVSLVDGYNLPISIIPSGGSGECKSVSCLSDLNLKCPSDLKVTGNDGSVVACKSACMAFNTPSTVAAALLVAPTRASRRTTRECSRSFALPHIATLTMIVRALLLAKEPIT